MASFMGALIGKFVIGIGEEETDTQVDEKGMPIAVPLETVTKFYMCLIAIIVGCLYEFLIIPLIPIRSEIEAEIDERNQRRVV